MNITISNKWLIAVAWGPRRIPKRYRDANVSAYPKEITASYKLWISWVRSGVASWIYGHVTTVIVPSHYRKEVTSPQVENNSPCSLTDAEINTKLQQRRKLRSEKDFITADKIRDELIAAGISVEDAKL